VENVKAQQQPQRLGVHLPTLPCSYARTRLKSCSCAGIDPERTCSGSFSFTSYRNRVRHRTTIGRSHHPKSACSIAQSGDGQWRSWAIPTAEDPKHTLGSKRFLFDTKTICAGTFGGNRVLSSLRVGSSLGSDFVVKGVGGGFLCYILPAMRMLLLWALLFSSLEIVTQSTKASDSHSDNPQAEQASESATPSAAKPETREKPVATGMLIHKVAPKYPKAARKAHIEGTVVLSGVIGKDGKVAVLRVVSGPKELTASAVKAVQKWLYKPYMLDGKPVDVETEVRVNFTLN
jgi:TonB family protein